MITLEAYWVSTECFFPRITKATLSIKRKFPHVFENLDFEVSRFFAAYTQFEMYTSKMCVILLLLLSGDVETNPGPFTILKSVQGNFHQGDVQLGLFVETQCTCTALFSIIC